MAVDGAACAVEANIGDVVLSARIETTADLDAEALYRLIDLDELCGQAFADFVCKASGGRNPQLAGVGAGAGCDVDDRAGSRVAQTDSLQLLIEIREIGLAHPSQHHVLLDSRTYILPGKLARDVGQLAHLPCRKVSQGKSDRSGGVTGLPLAVHVGVVPLFEAFRALLPVERGGFLYRSLLIQRCFLQVILPAGVFL